MEQLVVLARLGAAEVSALVGTAIFALIMAYLLFGGQTEKETEKEKKTERERKQPKPKRR